MNAAPVRISSNSNRASPMSRSRLSFSFWRQRRNSRTAAGGVSRGSVGQSGSRSSTAATVSEKVDPSKARFPASISKSTQPKAQTSPRRSTSRPRACSGLM